MKLINAAINKAKAPSFGITRLSDGKGLFLFINTNGSKLWRYWYRFNRKQQMLSFDSDPV